MFKCFLESEPKLSLSRWYIFIYFKLYLFFLQPFQFGLWVFLVFFPCCSSLRRLNFFIINVLVNAFPEPNELWSPLSYLPTLLKKLEVFNFAFSSASLRDHYCVKPDKICQQPPFTPVQPMLTLLPAPSDKPRRKGERHRTVRNITPVVLETSETLVWE